MLAEFGLEAAVLSAAAAGFGARELDVADLAGESGSAATEFPVDDEAAADAAFGGDVDEVAVSSSGAATQFQAPEVGVVASAEVLPGWAFEGGGDAAIEPGSAGPDEVRGKDGVAGDVDHTAPWRARRPPGAPRACGEQRGDGVITRRRVRAGPAARG